MIEFKRCADLATFEENISSVSNEDLVLIEAEHLIYNNGRYYYCSDQIATDESNGLMSAKDKEKLDSITGTLNGYTIEVKNQLPIDPDLKTIYMII